MACLTNYCVSCTDVASVAAMSQHTPGPWYISTPGRLDALYVGPVVVSSHRTALGQHASHPELLNHIDDDSLYANAKLISAAPDLLESLKAMVEIAELTLGWMPTPPDADGPLIQARAAITKATRDAA